MRDGVAVVTEAPRHAIHGTSAGLASLTCPVAIGQQLIEGDRGKNVLLPYLHGFLSRLGWSGHAPAADALLLGDAKAQVDLLVVVRLGELAQRVGRFRVPAGLVRLAAPRHLL